MLFENVIANYIGKFWGLISVFIFVPIYIRILGVEAYAVISFYTVVLTVMYFADGGLSSTLNREIARVSDKLYIGNILYTIERVYLLVCSLIVILIFCFSGFISKSWLNSKYISENDLSLYISLMGVSVAFQLFTTLYNSGLMGLEKQVLSNTIQTSSGISRSALVLFPLYFYPSLLTFFVWQVICNIIFFFITRYYLWKYIKGNVVYNFDIQILKTVGTFAGGMMLMSVISSLNTQIDKIVISKILSLEEFGHYSLAGLLSQIPVLSITPIAIAILPRMIKYSTNADKDELVKIFHVNSFVLSTLATSTAMILFLFTRDFVLIWTHDILIASSIENVTKVLLIGGVFLSFQYMPYHLAIANGHTKTNVGLGIISVICIIPTLIFFVKQFGLIGATYTWLIMNFLAYFYLGYSITNKFLKNEFNRWLVKGTLLPLFIAVIVGFLSYFLTINLQKGYYVLFYSFIIFFVTLAFDFFIFNKLYPDYKIKFKKILF